jgi:hypothetical protein
VETALCSEQKCLARIAISEYCDKENQVWLIFPKKQMANYGILYNNGVEETSSFGWIDSSLKRISKNSHAQYFSPRQQNNNY